MMFKLKDDAAEEGEDKDGEGGEGKKKTSKERNVKERERERCTNLKTKYFQTSQTMRFE